MKHIALNHFSRGSIVNPWNKTSNPTKLYTSPGLGDRVTCLWGLYQWAMKNNHESVTVHLNKNHWISGNPNVDKPKSWKEVEGLFINQGVNIQVKVHLEMPIQNDYNTLKWLKENKDVEASMYYYENPDADINITNYFKDKILLNPPENNVNFSLPKKSFVTMQWDGSGPRRPSDKVVDKVRSYYENNGYEIVDIGMRHSLAEIGSYLYHADYHIGMESGMFHMAQLYKNHSQIHIYTTPSVSAHTRRAKEYGSPINYLIGKII